MDEICEDMDAEPQRLADEIAGSGQDWSGVRRMRPEGWQSKARELGALRRLRGVGRVEALLRVRLIHLADGWSLRETAVCARAGGLAAVADVAWLKRLRGCGPWFQ